SAGLLVSPKLEALATTDSEFEIQLSSISAHTVRLSVLPLNNGKPGTIPSDGSLVESSLGHVIGKLRSDAKPQSILAGDIQIKFSPNPISFAIGVNGEVVQKLSIDQRSGIVSFLTGDSPLFGLGEGGPQFDRRGSIDTMQSGQGGYKLATHG